MARMINANHDMHAATISPGRRRRPAVEIASVVPGTPAYEAYRILHFTFTVAPILAGADKFVHALVDWDQYLAPAVARMLPVDPYTFMNVVGAIEIAAGLLVAFRPRLGGYVVALWLWGIIANLFLVPGYYDIALRDFGLSLGALALARLGADAQAARQAAFGDSQLS